MKYLDCPRLSLISSSLDDAIFGDRRVRGQTEAYSCKLAGDDKQLLKELKAANEEAVSYLPPTNVGDRLPRSYSCLSRRD